jgi:hypothetical protein
MADDSGWIIWRILVIRVCFIKRKRAAGFFPFDHETVHIWPFGVHF